MHGQRNIKCSLTCSQNACCWGLIPRQPNPVHVSTPYCFKVKFSIVLPASLHPPNSLFNSDFSNKCCVRFSFHLYVLQAPSSFSLISSLIFCCEHKLCSYWLCSFLHSLQLPLVNPTIFVSYPFSNTFSFRIARGPVSLQISLMFISIDMRQTDRQTEHLQLYSTSHSSTLP